MDELYGYDSSNMANRNSVKDAYTNALVEDAEEILRLPENEKKKIVNLIRKLIKYDRLTEYGRRLREKRYEKPTSTYMQDDATMNFLDDMLGNQNATRRRSRSRSRSRGGGKKRKNKTNRR